MTEAEALAFLKHAELRIDGDVTSFALGGLGLTIGELEALVRSASSGLRLENLWQVTSGDYLITIGLNDKAYVMGISKVR